MSHMRDPNSDVGCGVAWRGEKIAQEVLGGRSMPGGEARSLRGWLGLPTTRLRRAGSGTERHGGWKRYVFEAS